jgi:hypothetical protein
MQCSASFIHPYLFLCKAASPHDSIKKPFCLGIDAKGLVVIFDRGGGK